MVVSGPRSGLRILFNEKTVVTAFTTYSTGTVPFRDREKPWEEATVRKG